MLWVCMCAQSLSRVWLFVTAKTVARQAPLSMGCSRQEYWSGLTFPPPGALPDSGIEPTSPVSCIFCFGRWVLYYCATWEAHYSCYTGPIFFFFNFLVVLGLHRCVQTFSSCVEWWLFSSCRTQALGCGLSTCGTRLSCSVACGGFLD